MFVPVYMVDFLTSAYIEIDNNKQNQSSQELLQYDTTQVTK